MAGHSAYQMPKTVCMPRLTAAMATQQQKPVKIGFPPVLTSCTMLVFIPTAAMAMMMRNLLRSFSGPVTLAGSWHTVVMTAASTKKSTKKGKIFFRLILAPSSCLAWRVRKSASASVMGMMASVRVSLTMVAASRVLEPWMPSQAAAAAYFARLESGRDV